jgi:ribosomal protein L29
MADKKPAVKAPAKKVEKSLDEQLADKRAELMELKRSRAAGDLVNPRALTAARKEVARLLTTMNAPKEVN